MLFDDDKGVEEPLNEVDLEDGLGLRINARYYVQIFDHTKGKSLQRNQQMNIEQPL